MTHDDPIPTVVTKIQMDVHAYWFSKNGVSPYAPASTYEVRPEPYIQEGVIMPCKNGLHASVDPFDALYFAPEKTSTLDLVTLQGIVIPHGSPVNKKALVTAKEVIRVIQSQARRYGWAMEEQAAVEMAIAVYNANKGAIEPPIGSRP